MHLTLNKIKSDDTLLVTKVYTSDDIEVGTGLIAFTSKDSRDKFLFKVATFVKENED